MSAFVKAVEPDDWLKTIKKQLKSTASNKVSVEDILQQTTEGGDGQRKSGMQPTSPRSLRACLHCGIHPAELEWKPVSSFVGDSNAESSKDAATIRHAFYEKLRIERLEKLSEERRKIINDMAGMSGTGEDIAASSSTTVSGYVTPQASSSTRSALNGISMSSAPGRTAADAPIRDSERKRLQVLRKRQQKELSQMVNYEATRQAMQQLAQEKVRLAAKKSAAEKKEKVEAGARRQKMQREREMARHADEERIEAEARQKAAARYHAEQELLRREKERYQRLQKESHERDLERIRKAEEARRITELILREQQMELQRRQRSIEEKDEIRQAKIAEKRDALARENENKRRQAQERLMHAALNNKNILLAKRNAYEEKTRANELRRMEHEAARKKAADVKRDNDLQSERRRREMFAEAQKIERDRIESIRMKQEEAERTLLKVKRERDAVVAHKRMQKHLIAEEKQAKVESLRRQQAWMKEQALIKIEEDTARTQRLLEERLMLREKRKKANVQSSFMRQQLMEAIEKLQVKKAWNKVDLSGDGKLTLDALQAVVSGPSSPWRENHGSGSGSRSASRTGGHGSTGKKDGGSATSASVGSQSASKVDS